MTQPKEEKKVEPTKQDLEAKALDLAQHDAKLTAEIDAATKQRNEVRKKRRAVEGRLITININSKV